MLFRTDINGLRALAVLAVLFFHFSVPGFSGGYVGVDIFFVISGFLMTKIICTRVDDGAFGVKAFYAARAKRIVPALVVMVGVLLVLGFFWLIPFDYKALSEKSVAALLFVSNMMFAKSAGYFDTLSQNKWLLHTWSLAVEWQFYLLFPLWIIGLKKWGGGKYFRSGILGLFVLSLLGSVLLTHTEPAIAFFSLPTRIWEFVAGGLVFLYAKAFSKSSLIFWVGLLFIFISIPVYTEEMEFPGIYAALPVIGSVLVLSANKSSVLFNNRIMQYLGDVSYSLYLWHWPVVVGMHYLELEMTAPLVVFGIVLSFGLADLSYRLVEQVFRHVAPNRRSMHVLAGNAIAIFCVLIYAQTVVLAEGITPRVSKKVMAAQKIEKNEIYSKEGCAFNYKKENGLPVCIIGKEKVEPTVAIWGDSHAGSAAAGIERLIKKEKSAARLYAYAGCPPVLGVRFPGSSRSLPCNRVVQRTYDAIKADASIKNVLLISRWPVYSHGYNEASDMDIYATFNTNTVVEEGNLEQRLKEYSDEIVRTACGLQSSGKQVHLFATVPEIGKHVPFTLAKRLLLKRKKGEIGIPLEEYLDRNVAFLEAFAKAEKQCGARVVEVHDHFCEDGFCSGLKRGKSLYVDDDHLSLYGNKQLKELYLKALQ